MTHLRRRGVDEVRAGKIHGEGGDDDLMWEQPMGRGGVQVSPVETTWKR